MLTSVFRIIYTLAECQSIIIIIIIIIEIVLETHKYIHTYVKLKKEKKLNVAVHEQQFLDPRPWSGS